ncbi:hypothetical protein Sps_03613 [Shewanella psychrophila]|uniref:Uncharacterized protein n=1 Tax=Shewanella psychrophila TaxID=225848 RepID=A0A1S6HT70_9GAMM|nr:hypothetical protein [Shewanella psychrophila]AQS38740.1 hypothetical protein Sps_03613 [Shewanella psychrophila]
MSSMVEAMQYPDRPEESRELLKVIKMSVVDKRKRLGWQDKDLDVREVIGRWIDGRDGTSNTLTLYRQDDKIYLEIWSGDGCHSLDIMMCTQTDKGLKLEDKGGNIFGEYFLLSNDNTLQLCNSTECFYTAIAA